ncbi:class I SAM-dependent methyltransferase [Thiorhodococcus mannitoliphagus]|uniref:Class I SAM-dependent methyltransferase n=1 Tax=Thiorhodococcus mannitoliphagus TaxID=329406 RepID=A0A6P1DTU9_9GAMM|nr:class I SAM-dependent methyltransferase [Thiorhodococcus mannitoliphagus]NEX21747.1 class I SAM-dependent methyltransferase [Thiorhodococcus mannitoliphagus]
MTDPYEPQSHIVAPHPPLTDYYASEAERASFVRGIFDQTAPDYDRIEGLLALGTGGWYRRQALLRAGLVPGMDYLDLGVGTGILMRQAVRILGDASRATGVDPSPGMMALARSLPGGRLVEGCAERIPFADASFDFVAMGYVLRHIGDLSAAFRELNRVLRPGGRLCILEITRPEGRIVRGLLRTYIRGMVPALARLSGARRESARLWRYYWDTIDACAPPEQLVSSLGAAGFLSVRRHIDTRALSFLSEYQGRKPGASQNG